MAGAIEIAKDKRVKKRINKLKTAARTIGILNKVGSNKVREKKNAAMTELNNRPQLRTFVQNGGPPSPDDDEEAAAANTAEATAANTAEESAQYKRKNTTIKF